MALRYEGACRLCGTTLPARAKAVYERSTKTVRCVHCPTDTAPPAPAAPEPTPAPPTPITPPAPPPPAVPVEDTFIAGDAGGSARVEFERRHQRREDKVRAAHPKIGGFLLAVTDDPQSTAAWDKGAIGEEKLGRSMNKAAGPLLRVLHDRRVPRSTANIDHIAVTPSGVWVIDAKRYKGRPILKVEGGFLSPRVEKLIVGRRDCTKLVDSMLKQTEIVKTALEATGEAPPIHAALCFVDADWPLFGGAITTRGVRALWWDKLLTILRKPGDLDQDAIRTVWERLTQALPAYQRKT